MHANQPVFLTTRTPYPLPSQKFVIPTSWKRFHLSQLVNKAVGLEKAVPFDFLIKGGLNADTTGEMLAPGMTLGDWCAANGVGEEDTVEIEYVESVMPPQKVGEIEAQDWISGVRGVDGYVMTASFDGHLRLFDHSKNSIMDVPVHSAPITSLSLISSSDDDEEKVYTIATSSHDLSACITQLTIPTSPASSKTQSSKVLASLHLHTQPLSSVVSNANGSKLLTSSWDGLIGVWDTAIPTIDEVPMPDEESMDKKKRRKIENGASSNGKSADTKRKAPMGVLKSHVGRVSKAAFLRGGEGGEGKAVSAGYDSTVRIWDLEYGVCERTIPASEKPFLDLAPAQSGQTLLAASTDRTVTQYDIRASSQAQSLQAAVASFSHAATPSCVCVPPSSFSSSSPSSSSEGQVNSHQFITGAYDGIVRVWDMRNPKGAMAAFKTGEGDSSTNNAGPKRTKKILCVDWRKGLLSVGGEGGMEIWKVGEEA
ncbi:ribosome biogenesis protein YTM1 [Panaeolus papilionaceus]|nr:ribosome biogenesis protein YTM1 [Panaeolus papilionaceus]